MYELIKHELQKVDTIETPSQVAIVKTTIENVIGNESEKVILIESLPEKEEHDGITELHFINGKLEWVYKPAPPSYEQQIIDEYTLSLIEMGVL